ncbi:MAG: hypothetical protein Q8941_15210 [Bacteroidota bacterium]|nr:hypothetical protein [Bacteroidota bacterium]
MKKDTIVQFVCFITDIGLDEFMPKWERYAKRLMKGNAEMTLQQRGETKTRFRYISQHVWPDQDFRFTFMNERQSEHFPEHNVKVVQAGGYLQVQAEGQQQEDNGDHKLVAFIGHNENDIDFYRRLSCYRFLNIFQAYYESCLYGYVLEFIVSETDIDELVQLLKQRSGVETGIYKDCLVPHV